ncbi:MAG: hypothetical protein A2Y62_14805 [Candidatus Fischerbacteria bacterium RBG_13_37_8]|uniref:Uncharacterized protein n=1 Tax=Candidatus Fischerbacteria bacterium RBG_13_37_8 TaxID=1817863 RepID=A0A1F5VMW6_9BACT|nr:MAG: hypothetical protein A2Y62_14805 [Candidatus Fischerbacteria bacterium RBG_13_37_8]
MNNWKIGIIFIMVLAILLMNQDSNALVKEFCPVRYISVKENDKEIDEFVDVASDGYMSELLEIMRNNPDIVKTAGGEALRRAASNEHVEIVRELLKAGVDINDPGLTSVLHAALSGGNEIIVREILAAGAQVNVRDLNGWTPLHYAAMGWVLHTDLAKLLLQAGADPNVLDHYCAPPIPEVWIDDIKDELIKAGAIFDLMSNQSETASQSTDRKEINTAIDNGKEAMVDIVQQKNRLNYKLIMASCLGNAELVKKLIKEGANVKFKDKTGTTALMMAALKKHTEVVKELIQAGADVNARDYEGDTPLHAALYMMSGRSHIARELIKASADVNMFNDRGCSPFHLVALRGCNYIELTK